jgi:hypothetical protein
MIEADEEMLREAGASLEELEDELALPESVRLFTVDPGGAWRRIDAITDMRGALHKNVLICPSPLAGQQIPSPLAGEGQGGGSAGL